MKTVATCNDDVLSESTDELYSIEYVEISDVDSYSGITKTSALQFGEAPSRARRIIKHGDILVSTVRTYLRAIAAVDNPPDNLIASTGFAVIRPRRIESGFLGYLFQAEYLVSKIISYSVGVSYPAINASELMRFGIPFPPLEEQQAIAAFLDAETSRIDALMAEYETLIELLKEKRQALISHAVTKGLNPDVPLKASGVEWLGDVPEGWVVKPIKQCCSIRYGIGEPPQYRSTGVPLIRATNIHAGKLFSEGLAYVDPKDIPGARIVWLQPGDIIVVRSGAYTGDSAIIPVGIENCIAGFDMVLQCNGVNAMFVQYALLSNFLKNAQIDLEKMRAAQPHLNSVELGNCVLLAPPLVEQSAIVAFLDAEISRIDGLVQEAETGVNLLRERRMTLISDAVVGKIDVRDWKEAI